MNNKRIKKIEYINFNVGGVYFLIQYHVILSSTKEKLNIDYKFNLIKG